MTEIAAPAAPAPDRPRRLLPSMLLAGLLMGCCAVLLPGFERYQAGYAGWEAGLSTAAGGLLAMQLAHLMPLLLGRVAGVAPTLLVVGTGPLLRVRRGRRATIAFHAVPLPLLAAHGSLVARAGLRSRLALLALGRVAVGLGVAELLLLSGDPFLWGMGRGVVLFTVIALVLWAGGRKAGHLGWWPAPWWNRDEAVAHALDPAGIAAARALAGGDLARAHAELPGSAGTLTPLQLRAALAVAEGRCAEALRLAAEGHGTEPDEELRLLAARAACHAVESGELSADDAQPPLRLLYAHGPRRLFRSSELPATRALLMGSPAEAVRLARRALGLPLDLTTRGYALCTLAAAQARTGDVTGARASLGRARECAPGLARIGVVEGLISSSS